MENQEETLLARWLSGELTEAELEQVQRREDFHELSQIVKAAGQFKMPGFDEDVFWAILKEKMSAGKPAELPQEETVSSPTLPEIPVVHPVEVPVSPAPQAPVHEGLAREGLRAEPTSGAKIRKLHPWKYAAAIAAGIALFILAGIWFSRPEESCQKTAVAEHLEGKLPDGSTVFLNAESEMCYPVKKWSDERYVKLKGEAYFKVKKGKQFTVRTEQGLVKVVGTTFNVYARNDELEVQCSDGKVQVSNEDETQKVLLKSGETVRVVKGRMQKREGLARHPTWYKGESYFRAAPLEKVFDEMERQYGVLVLADSIEGRTYSGKFVHKDLRKALKMVCEPMKLEYSVSGDTVRVFH